MSLINYSIILFSIILSIISFNSIAEPVEQLSVEARLSQFPLESQSKSMSTIPERKIKEEFCSAVNRKFLQFGWYKIICDPNRWEIFKYSSQGNPIVYQEFGFDDPDNNVPINLVLCG